MVETPLPGTPEYRRSRALRTERLLRRIVWGVFLFCLPVFGCYVWVYALSVSGVPVTLDYPWIMVLGLIAMAGAPSSVLAVGVLAGKVISTRRANQWRLSFGDWFRGLRHKWIPLVAFLVFLGGSLFGLIYHITNLDKLGSYEDNGRYYVGAHENRREVSEAQYRSDQAHISWFLAHNWTTFAWITISAWGSAAVIELRPAARDRQA